MQRHYPLNQDVIQLAAPPATDPDSGPAADANAPTVVVERDTETRGFDAAAPELDV